MRTARIATLLAFALSCRCEERPNLVPPREVKPAHRASGRETAATDPAAAAAPSAQAPAPGAPPAAPPGSPTGNAPPAAARPPLPLAEAVAVEPGAIVAIAATGESVVDPSSTFRVEISVPLPDVRVVLLDANDDHVPATSTHEVTRTTRVELAPARPLVPASRYVLRVEGAAGTDPRGADGTTYAPASLALVAAGSPPPPEPPPKRKRRR